MGAKQGEMMPEKDPDNVNWFFQTIPFIFAVFMSSLGGAISYLNRIDKEGISFNIFRFVLDIVTSGFVGVITFMLCDAANISWSITAALVAISGHMGARALLLAETILVSKIKEKFNYGNSKGKTRGKETTNHDA